MTPEYEDGTVTLYAGDCLDVMAGLPDASVDAVVTDPPYGLEFMGKEWDAPWRDSRAYIGRGGDVHGKPAPVLPQSYVAGASFQHWCEQWAAECLRVLKPGGHLAAFGGTRTWHRLACAIEDAGFKIRDCLAWMYGSGFPKSLDVSKAIDKAAGAEREVVGEGPYASRKPRPYEGGTALNISVSDPREGHPITAAATDAARQWQGWGTALKPAYEPIVLARKPLAGTVAANVQSHGTGALNIDGCRVGTADGFGGGARASGGFVNGYESGDGFAVSTKGRWPANVVLDDTAAAMLDEQSGVSSSNVRTPTGTDTRGVSNTESQTIVRRADTMERGHNDTGGASRFFYTAKAGRDERPTADGVAHPTVKPLDLMRWLVRLVTPPAGVVLEPFAGSGTTAEACIIEGFRCIAIEREPDYIKLIRARLSKAIQPTLDGA